MSSTRAMAWSVRPSPRRRSASAYVSGSRFRSSDSDIRALPDDCAGAVPVGTRELRWGRPATAPPVDRTRKSACNAEVRDAPSHATHGTDHPRGEGSAGGYLVLAAAGAK